MSDARDDDKVLSGSEELTLSASVKEQETAGHAKADDHEPVVTKRELLSYYRDLFPSFLPFPYISHLIK
jgi:hypothetical protein